MEILMAHADRDPKRKGFSEATTTFDIKDDPLTRTLDENEVAQLRATLDSEVLYVALSRSITAAAVDKFEERHRNNRTLYMTLAAAAASFVLAVGGFAVNAFIGLRVDQRIEAEREVLGAAFGFSTKVAALNTEVFTMDQNEGLNAQEADRLIETTQQLYQNFASSDAVNNGLSVEEISENRRLMTFSVERLINNTIAAGLGERARRIVEFAPEVAETNTSVLQSLIQSYGRDLLEDVAAPRSWLEEDGAQRRNYERYRALALRAKDSGYPELYLLFELLIRHVEAREDSEMQALVDRIETLNDTDRRFFMELIVDLGNGKYKRTPDNETRHVARIVRDFIENYKTDDETFTLLTASGQLKPLN